MSQNIALPDYPNHVKAIAVEALEVLTASVHWMKIPKEVKQREIMVRRWAGGIAESRLSDEGVRKAVAAYLNSRWAKDPIPEPNDVFGVSDEKLDEYNGGGNSSSQMRMIRRYLTIAHNWWGVLGDPEREHELTWEGTGVTADLPDNLPDILEAMGETELAQINRTYR